MQKFCGHHFWKPPNAQLPSDGRTRRDGRATNDHAIWIWTVCDDNNDPFPQFCVSRFGAAKQKFAEIDSTKTRLKNLDPRGAIQ